MEGIVEASKEAAQEDLKGYHGAANGRGLDHEVTNQSSERGDGEDRKGNQVAANESGQNQEMTSGNGEKEEGEDQKENCKLANQSLSWACPDGTFIKQILAPGEGLDKPKEGSLCQLWIEAPPGCPVSYPTDRWAEVVLGSGDATWDGVVDRCLQSMLAGEQAELRLTTDAILLIRLASFTPGKDSWELSPEERWRLVLAHKERGGQLYRAGQTEAAAGRYTKALRLTVAAPLTAERDQAKADLHANLAACQLRLAQPAHAARNCTKALALRPGAAKLLYRRGLAQTAMNDLEGAVRDLRGALATEPGNRAARRELEKVTERIRERDARLGQAMRKLFG